jgi:hypothetical protein
MASPQSSPPGAVKRPQRFPTQIGFVWGFYAGAQGAYRPKTTVSGPGRSGDGTAVRVRAPEPALIVPYCFVQNTVQRNLFHIEVLNVKVHGFVLLLLRHYQIAVKIKPLYLTNDACHLTSNTTRVVQ